MSYLWIFGVKTNSTDFSACALNCVIGSGDWIRTNGVSTVKLKANDHSNVSGSRGFATWGSALFVFHSWISYEA